MKVRNTRLPGVLVISPKVHQDHRGFFLETYNHNKYTEHKMPTVFVQDNYSASRHATLRGLHTQLRRPQCKLIRVVKGEIFDVAVDVRPNSETFCQWTGVYLSDQNYKQCYIPPGYAHGFCVLSDEANVEYKCSTHYDPADEVTIAWNDTRIGVEWPIDSPLLSPRDRAAPGIDAVTDQLSAHF